MSSAIEDSTFFFECCEVSIRFLKTAQALRSSSSAHLDDFNCMANVLAVVLVEFSSTIDFSSSARLSDHTPKTLPLPRGGNALHVG